MWMYYYCKFVHKSKKGLQQYNIAMTRLFEPHIHMYSRTTDDYDAMSKAGIEDFFCISVKPKEAMERPLALDAVEAMKKYLDRERVVAVGELGYNLINDLEEEVFVKQMDIAADKDMLMTVHLPHNNKPEGMKRIERIVNSETGRRRYKRHKILVDHNVEETIEK